MAIVRLGSRQTLGTLLVCLLIAAGGNTFAEGVPDDCTQLILGIAPTWNSMRGELRLFEFPDIDQAAVSEVLIMTNTRRCYVSADPAALG